MSQDPQRVQTTERPVPLHVIPENIPHCLHNWPRWVCWYYRWQEPREGHNGRWAKCPIDPKTGRAASVERPDTWGTFEQALALMNQKGLAGIGIVLGFGLNPDNPHRITGFDFDHCRDLTTGLVNQTAKLHVASLNSYTEVSPSATGLHTLCLADLGPGPNKKGNVEVYHQGRYIAMTGHRLEGTPAGIEQRHGEASILRREWIGETPRKSAASAGGGDARETLPPSIATVLDTIARAKNGPRFAELRDATRENGRDQSADDLAFCRILAFYCRGSAGQMKTIWQTAPRWGIHSDREDYVDRTIARAIADQGGKYHDRYRRMPSEGVAAGSARLNPPYSGPGGERSRTQVGGLKEPLRGEVQAGQSPREDSMQGPRVNGNGIHTGPQTPPPVSFSSPRPSPPAAPSPASYGVVASTFREKETRWFWEPWFAFDVLNVLVGRKNVGKSSLVAKLMAMAKRPVILPGFEEDVERMMMARWRVAGVNLDNVKVLNDQPYSPQLMKDLFVKILRDWGADLFVVEMMDSYLPDEKSENNSQDVRPFLEALREIAERSGACVVGTRHPGKDVENVMRGSQAWENVPRIIVTLETFEGPPVRRWMSSHQCGVAEKPPAVSYELRREGMAPPVFIAGELADPKAVELARAVPDVEDRQLLEVCKDWLARFLADGEKLVATILVEGKKLGFSDRTIYRAKKALDVKHRGEGQGGNYRSYWHLP